MSPTSAHTPRRCLRVRLLVHRRRLVVRGRAARPPLAVRIAALGARQADRLGDVLGRQAPRQHPGRRKGHVAHQPPVEGDAQAARLFAEAASQDPAFFAFHRSLEAYRAAFADGKGVIVLEKDDPFLQYFKNER